MELDHKKFFKKIYFDAYFWLGSKGYKCLQESTPHGIAPQDSSPHRDKNQWSKIKISKTISYICMFSIFLCWNILWMTTLGQVATISNSNVPEPY